MSQAIAGRSGLAARLVRSGVTALVGRPTLHWMLAKRCVFAAEHPHHDNEVARWYDGWNPSHEEAAQRAQEMADGWRLHGVPKGSAYDRASGEVVGRGGLSRTPGARRR